MTTEISGLDCVVQSINGSLYQDEALVSEML